MKATVNPTPRLAGRLRLPGDKSISHRALMLGAICQGVTEIGGIADGEDNHSTRRVLGQLGVDIAARGERVRVRGLGPGSLRAPQDPLHCGNSGTTMRLLTGLLAGQGVAARLVGDASLSRRPMGRVVDPLRAMGFDVKALGEGGRPPLELVPEPRAAPAAFTYDSPVASAQVKSCLLLAGLGAGRAVTVREPSPSRDHTERLLRDLGYRVQSSPNYATPDGGPAEVAFYPPEAGFVPSARPIEVPGDISAAAFFLVAALLTRSGQLVLEGVSTNPTRTGVLDALEAAGAHVQRGAERVLVGGEPAADLSVALPPGGLGPLHVDKSLVPRLVDEIPVLAVLAALSHGESRFLDVGELRVKECDRLEATAELLRAAGVRVRAEPRALYVSGPARIRAFRFDARADHRMAMAAAVAALVADGPCRIDGAEAHAVSHPGFFDDLARVAGSTVAEWS